jgi:hypothetical protein
MAPLRHECGVWMVVLQGCWWRGSGGAAERDRRNTVTAKGATASFIELLNASNCS